MKKFTSVGAMNTCKALTTGLDKINQHSFVTILNIKMESDRIYQFRNDKYQFEIFILDGEPKNQYQIIIII